ncbi:MAG: flagellar hook-length control protein FliK [Parvibaculales bacterium]
MSDIVLNGKTLPLAPANAGLGDGQGDALLSGLFTLLVAAEIAPDENGDFVLDDADLAGLEQQAANDGETDPAIAALLMLAQAARATGSDGGKTGQPTEKANHAALWPGVSNGTGPDDAGAASGLGHPGKARPGLNLPPNAVTPNGKAATQTPIMQMPTEASSEETANAPMVKLSAAARHLAEKSAAPTPEQAEHKLAGATRPARPEAGEMVSKNEMMTARQMADVNQNSSMASVKAASANKVPSGNVSQNAGGDSLAKGEDLKLQIPTGAQSGLSVKSISPDNGLSSTSGNAGAPSAAAVAGLGDTGQGGQQQGSQQQGGQQSFTGSNSFAGQGSGNPAARLGDTLDMMSREWQEKLIDRVEKSFRSGEAEIDLTLSPKSLGRMRVSLGMNNGQLDVVIRADSSAAANLLGESEARLSQMLEASGLRIGQFMTGTGGDFGRGGTGQNGSQAGNAASSSAAETAETETASSSPSGVATDNVVNVTA